MRSILATAAANDDLPNRPTVDEARRRLVKLEAAITS
jgi:hypothetical protein